jgi:hypothetical protein
VTAPLVTLDAHDFDAERFPIMRALQGLVDVHSLPEFQKVYHSRSTTVVALSAADAESWRAALGAPPYICDGERCKTERLWFGSMVRLVFANPELVHVCPKR